MKRKVCVLVTLVASLCLSSVAFGQGALKPTGVTLGAEGTYKVNEFKQVERYQTPEGLFDGKTGGYSTPECFYFYEPQYYIDITLNQDTTIWGIGQEDYKSYLGQLTCERYENGTWVLVGDSLKADTYQWNKLFANLPAGRYKFHQKGVEYALFSEWYLETVKLPEPTVTDETITIETPINEIEIGKEFTTDVVLHNGVNVCAEDVVVNYDKNLFEYLGYEEAAGFKVYKEMPADGSVRFITASKGKVNAINGDKTFVKLKFRAKQEGTGKVDAMTARIADNGTYEKDLKVDLCGEKVIKVTGIKDVNRTGKFTLLDLGIDAWYHGMKAEETDKSKYDCDVVVDSNIDDLDLSSIVTAMLANPEYNPHN